MRRMECSNESGLAMGTPENRSHRSRIQTQRAYSCGRAAGLALNLRARYLKDEDFLKKTRGSIAVENESRVIASHDAHPEGPKRSVLIATGLCPSSTRNVDAASTRDVGPQTKIFGFCPGGKHASASNSLSIRRR